LGKKSLVCKSCGDPELAPDYDSDIMKTIFSHADTSSESNERPQYALTIKRSY
jgi:hypothetical protein